LLGLGVAALYAIAIVALLAIVPQPRSRTDYLVIGTVATLAALVAVFVFVAASGGGIADLFFRKRRR
jgi:hypothetical protein